MATSASRYSVSFIFKHACSDILVMIRLTHSVIYMSLIGRLWKLSNSLIFNAHSCCY